VLGSLLRRYGRFIKFGCVGGSVMLTGMALLYLLVDVFGLPSTVSYVIQAVVAINLNFSLNYLITWSDRKTGRRNWQRFLRNWTAFLSTRLITIPLNTILFTILDRLVHYLIAGVFTVVVVMIFNYLVNDRFVFTIGKTASLPEKSLLD
jgi:putative flippase GtrA